MATRVRAETPEGRRRRTEAQMTKAWQLLHYLRRTMTVPDEEIIAWLQLCDDRDWNTLREAADVRPTADKGRRLSKGGTSCSISRDVKAIIFSNLAGTRASEPEAGQHDVLATRRADRRAP